MSGRHRLPLALRLLARDWRAGELQVLVAALVIAVGASTAVGFFTQRIAGGLLQQSAELLGADLVLDSPRPLDPQWREEAERRGLRTTETLEFATMVLRGEALQLARVKAVANGYPLRGRLRVTDTPFGADAPVDGIPGRGEAWVDARLLTRLQASLGGTVQVGESALRVTRVLSFEPGQGGALFGVSPRLLMNRADVDATGIIQPGSRVSYQYLFAGASGALDRYRRWLEPQLEPSHELIGIREGRRAVGTALERAERYMGLSIVAAIVLAGVAIAMAARRYSARHFDTSAVLRCLGATQADLMALYLPQLGVLALVGSAVGCLLGWLAQQGLFVLLAGILPVTPAEAGLGPVLAGFAIGVISLAGFALPPFLRLREVPPLRVLRQDLAPLPSSAWLVYGAAGAAVIAIVWRYTGNWSLTLAVLTGGAAAALALAVLALVLLRLGRRINRRVGVAWRFGLNHLWRRSGASLGQIMAFGLILMAMTVTGLVRTDLLEAWRTQLPVRAPNHFAVNILPDRLEAMEKFLADRDIEGSAFFPMVRGRLTTLNGEPVQTAVTKEAQDDNALNRELNLTWTRELQEDNAIVAGRWWDSDDLGMPRVSVESQLAKRLGIELDDQLGFSIAGETFSARVTSIRSVQWDSFRPNFYMIFPPGVLEGQAATYMTSFYLPAGQKAVLTELVRTFPAVTVLELDLIMQQVERIFTQVTLAVEYVLVFVLLAGFAVLFAALQTSLDERLYEGALLRALGARRVQLRAGHLAEFGALGFMAGLIAALGTECLAWLLYRELLGLEFRVHWEVWVLTPLAGSLLVGIAGYLGTRAIVRQSPLPLLTRT